MSEPDAQTPGESGETVLDPTGGVPAVAVGTRREKAEERPAAVRDSANADIPGVATGSDGGTGGQANGGDPGEHDSADTASGA